MTSAAAAGISVSECVGEALDFARDAWRDAFAPMALCIFGWTAITVSAHGVFLDRDAALTRHVGMALLIFVIPLSGALFRAALGGSSFAKLGPGGLQVTMVEVRLAAVAALLAAALLVCAAPLMGVSGLAYLGLRKLGVVHLGPLGGWAVWFLAAALAWGAALAGIAFILARLSLLSPIAAAEDRISPRLSWRLTEGSAWALVKAWLVLHIPTLVALLASSAIGWIATDDLAGGGAGGWPMPAAIALGLITGGLVFALQVPLSVGFVAFAYDVLRVEQGEATAEAERIVEPLPVTPTAAVEAQPPPSRGESHAAVEEESGTPDKDIQPGRHGLPPAVIFLPAAASAGALAMAATHAGAGDDASQAVADDPPTLEDHGSLAAQETADPDSYEPEPAACPLAEPAASDPEPDGEVRPDHGREAMEAAESKATEPGPEPTMDPIAEPYRTTEIAPPGEPALAPAVDADYIPPATADPADETDSTLEPAGP